MQRGRPKKIRNIAVHGYSIRRDLPGKQAFAPLSHPLILLLPEASCHCKFLTSLPVLSLEKVSFHHESNYHETDIIMHVKQSHGTLLSKKQVME